MKFVELRVQMFLHVSGVGLADNVGLRGPGKSRSLSKPAEHSHNSSQTTQRALVKIIRAARLRETTLLLQTDIAGDALQQAKDHAETE